MGQRTCSRVAGEVAGPDHICAAGAGAGRDGVQPDRGDDARVAERRLGADDRVGDEVVDVLSAAALANAHKRSAGRAAGE